MPIDLSPDLKLPEPWDRFLNGVDEALSQSVQLHCVGGFVVTILYGLPRRTEDIDYISVEPADVGADLQAIAGKGSKLAKKYKVHLDFVTISEPPENYQERLKDMFPRRFSKLRLYALEVHDLMLTKLTRNHPVDREDVKLLAKGGHLNPDILRDRYQHEIRPRLAAPERHDLTLDLWIDDYFPKP